MLPSTLSSLDEFERKFVAPAPGLTYVIGSKIYQNKPDRRKRYANAIGIDMLEGEGVDLVADLEEPLAAGLQQAQHIECMSVLEHSRRPWLLAANLDRLLAPGGTIFVSVPFIWRIHAYPDDYWRLTPSAVRSIFPNIEWAHVMIAAERLTTKRRSASARIGGHPYLARAETVAFGRKIP